MVHKTNLKGKYVRFMDRDGKTRTQKVIKVRGAFLTVVNCLKKKTRVHKDRVIAQETRKRGLIPIDWGRNNGGKRT